MQGILTDALAAGNTLTIIIQPDDPEYTGGAMFSSREQGNGYPYLFVGYSTPTAGYSHKVYGVTPKKIYGVTPIKVMMA